MNKTLRLNPNIKLIKIFSELVDYYKILDDNMRVNVYERVLMILNKYPNKIKSSKDITNYYGIGEGLEQKIDEILETDKLTILEEFKKNKKLNQIKELTNIIGIGPKKANELVKLGITDIDKLKKSGKNLGKIGNIGLKYHSKINLKLTRKDISNIVKNIRNIIDNNYEIIIAGGYNINKSYFKDIDIIIRNIQYPERKDIKNKKIMNIIINELNELLVENLSFGKEKYSGLIKYNKNKIAKIDIHLIGYNNLFYHLQYFGYGKEYSKKLRSIAKKEGYKLNEFGLFKDNKKIQNGEKKIKEFINMI